MTKIALDIGWTKIIWALFNENNEIIKTIKLDIWEYILEKVIWKIQNIIDDLSENNISYIWISLNWQINNGYVYFSRVLGWIVNKNLIDFLKIPKDIDFKVDNDVNCMCLWANYLEEEKSDYYVLLNVWTWLRSSYLYKWKILRWKNWFFWEIRDDVEVLELDNTININDLVCWRWISNIYKILWEENLDAKEIYKLSKTWDDLAKKTIDIFIKQFIKLICRISYIFNPEIIVVDGSVKKIIEENYERVISMYETNCEKHFQTKIKVIDYENTALYGALFIN